MSAISRRIKGKAKELEGKMTGDKLREAQGAVENAAGRAASAAKSGMRNAKARALKTKAGRKAAAAKATP